MITWKSDSPGVLSTSVSSISDLIDVLRELSMKSTWGCNADNWQDNRLFAKTIWFRGQREDILPSPSICYRVPPEMTTGRFDEVSLFSDFQSRLGNRPEMPSTTDALSWLALMRHYDLPNRALDWSESLLVALLFALNEDKGHGKYNPTLFVLNARALNEVTRSAKYLTTPLDKGSIPLGPFIWVHDSFPAIQRAEQSRCRYYSHWSRILLHSHQASRGYVSEEIINDLVGILGAHKGTNSDDYIQYILNIEAVREKYLTDAKKTKETPYEKRQYLADLKDFFWSAMTPAAVQPPWNSTRILTQKGMLTVHGGAMSAPTPYGDDSRPPRVDLSFIAEHCAMEGMIIRKTRITEPNLLRKEVSMLGFEYLDLMPEIEHQVKAICRKHGNEQEFIKH